MVTSNREQLSPLIGSDRVVVRKGLVQPIEQECGHRHADKRSISNSLVMHLRLGKTGGRKFCRASRRCEVGAIHISAPSAQGRPQSPHGGIGLAPTWQPCGTCHLHASRWIVAAASGRPAALLSTTSRMPRSSRSMMQVKLRPTPLDRPQEIRLVKMSRRRARPRLQYPQASRLEHEEPLGGTVI